MSDEHVRCIPEREVRLTWDLGRARLRGHGRGHDRLMGCWLNDLWSLIATWS